MQSPSEEQSVAIQNIVLEKNVMVDACAGSGKSTTILSCAKILPQKQFLQMTYNKDLRQEVKENIEKYDLLNINVHTFHSFAVKYYSDHAYDDMGIRKLLRENTPPRIELPKIDILVLDECQDMTMLYFKLMVKSLFDMDRPFQLFILGDKKQGLYEFKGAYIGFLTFAQKIWVNHPLLKCKDFVCCSLKMSYRITQPMADFINHAMLGEIRLLACKPGAPVKYFRRPTNTLITILIQQIKTLLQNKDNSYGDIFILAGSVKSKNIRRIENQLVQAGIPCYVPMIENKDQLDRRVINNKIVFSTFHSVKGRQRKHTFISGFDSTHMEYFDRDSPKDVCPNPLYVGTSRATNTLIIFETEQPNIRPLPFLKWTHIDMKLQTCVDFIGNPMTMAPIPEKKEEGDYSKTKYLTVTSLIQFVPEDVLDVIFPILDRIFVLEKPADPEPLDIPSIIETKSGFFEEVSNLNGIAIPIMFYDYLRNEGSCKTLQRIILQDIKRFKENEHAFLKNVVKNMPETCDTLDDYLYMANILTAVEEELYSKLIQIDINEYTWLKEDVVETCFDRLDETVGEECRNGKWSPEKIIIHSSADEDHKDIDDCLSKLLSKEFRFRFTARIDLTTQNYLWEMKCTSQITVEHKMQTVIYAWLYEMVYKLDKKKQFRLFNIKTNELWKLKYDLDDLTKIVVELLRGKFSKIAKKTDDEYIEEANSYILNFHKL
jgi:hypothetical protein